MELVAESGDQGARATDLGNAAELPVATARRILQALVAERLLSFDKKAHRYSVGPAVFAYAVRANPWFSDRNEIVRVLEEIAAITGDTVLFSIRSGDEAICLDRREGSYPIRVMSLGPGDRRPLGVGSGSAALLTVAADDDRETILERCRDAYAHYDMSPDQVRSLLDEARHTGYAYNSGRLVEGVHGVGVPVLDSAGTPAAISVAAVADRMDLDRRIQIVETIRGCLESVSGVRAVDLRKAP